MRVYLPVKPAEIKRLIAERGLRIAAGFAVTPSLQAWYGPGDAEELEYAASFRAAEAAPPSTGGLRYVLPVEVPDDAVIDRGDPADPGAVTLAVTIQLGWVAAILAGEVDELSWFGVQEAPELLG